MSYDKTWMAAATESPEVVLSATVDGRHDHRIVRALSVAALAAEGTTTVRGAEHVDVSFPGFFDAMGDLGMDVERGEPGE